MATHFYRIFGFSRILFYMFLKIIELLVLKIFSRFNENEWIDREVIKWARFCQKPNGVSLIVENKEELKQINWDRSVVFVGNHQSYTDVPIFLSAVGQRFGFVAKYELSKIPFFNYWMKKVGCVFINRKNFVSAVKELKALEKKGTATRLGIFPEGTRSKDGEVGEFKRGVLKIAWQLEAQLAPMLISKSREAWENRSSMKKQPVKARFIPIIDLKKIKENKTFNEFVNELEELFKHELNSI